MSFDFKISSKNKKESRNRTEQNENWSLVLSSQRDVYKLFAMESSGIKHQRPQAASPLTYARAYLCPQLNHSAPLYRSGAKTTKRNGDAIARKFRISEILFRALSHPGCLGPLAIDRIGISFVRVFNGRLFVFVTTRALHESTRFLRPLLRISPAIFLFFLRPTFFVYVHDLFLMSARFARFARVSENSRN